MGASHQPQRTVTWLLVQPSSSFTTPESTGQKQNGKQGCVRGISKPEWFNGAANLKNTEHQSEGAYPARLGTKPPLLQIKCMKLNIQGGIWQQIRAKLWIKWKKNIAMSGVITSMPAVFLEIKDNMWWKPPTALFPLNEDIVHVHMDTILMRFCCALRYSYGTCKFPPIMPLGDISPVSLSVTISVLSFSSRGRYSQPDSTRALISQALLLYKA